MPTPIGGFIPQEVYDGRLQSQHTIDSKTCLAFVQADGEEAKTGTSQIVKHERSTGCIQLVRNYYQKSNSVVITPYDAQCGKIEQSLKVQNLPWQGRVFSVDSFQEDQADIVIVSTVRTASHGFLKNTYRVNVVLTRCKLGMVIVSNSRFLHEGHWNCLLRELAVHWEQEGDDDVWID
ncbi:hypothetical protein M422DRAFT_196214 [Sphaerobolus stellatus SS14]|uniref:DNA2/NAM7 helicase-like C-terminal domain-containing protein n=1 Tax=Sphaerobolus stellatus (strain SS14) TaxID=990650 RepID=A0A0C9T2Z7_SPHS4|nr:hypothetical protein M422DRAFT_196214 [Sphaerobolus stellatus SS14]